LQRRSPSAFQRAVVAFMLLEQDPYVAIYLYCYNVLKFVYYAKLTNNIAFKTNITTRV